MGNFENADCNGFHGVMGDGCLHGGGGTRTTEGQLSLRRMRAALFLGCRFATDREALAFYLLRCCCVALPCPHTPGEQYLYISSNLYPFPNSRWLHHTALRYGRRAQSGACMWWKGLNSVKTSSKRAKNTCLSIPNGVGSLLEKRVFDPFLTHFWSQNGPFSRHCGIFHEPKPVATGSKWAKTTCLSIINGPGSFLEKRVFHRFLTHCWSQNGPFSRYFGIFHGPKRATRGSKRPKNTCLSIPRGLGTTLEEIIFFAPGTLVDRPFAPTVRGLAGPPAAPSDHWYGGLRGSLGDSEASKE